MKKIMRKIAAGSLSAALTMTSTVSASSALIGNFSASAADSFITSEFESGADKWDSRGNAQVSLDRENFYSGSSSLKVSGRIQDWNGAATLLSPNVFQAGSSYSFSAAVLQKSGVSTNIKMTLQYTLGGTENYDQIALVPAESGKWTDISNPDYNIPAGAENLILYIEIPSNLTDFYIDSFTAAEKGTPSNIVTGKGTVDGVGSTTETPSSSSDMRGDFNGDGIIDAFDVISARDVLAKSFSGSTQNINLSIADIDGNGTYEISDLVLLSKYVLGQISSFPEIIPVVTTTTAPSTQPPVVTTTTTPTITPSGNYMEEIAADMQIKAPSNFTQTRGGVDYGKMEKKTYYSKDGGINKNMNVLLPPGYDPNEKYPVLYVLHGIFGDETSMPGMGIQTMIGNLVADGKAEKMIIVFPAMFTGSGSPGFTAESSRKYDLIREDIENSIMPFMEQNYSIKTGKENTAITGFSMGGREALYTGITRSEVYGYVGAACPAPGIFETTDNYMHHEGCLTEGEFKPSTSQRMILISAAQVDGVVREYPKTYHDALDKNGVQHLWQIIPDGDHGGNTVTPHMYNFLRYVFK